jgi:putative nucleotidyltransferase with HDIG domain
LVSAAEIRLSEIIAAFSVALDITQGHPEGHCMRSALIAMRFAEELKLSEAEQSALFYAVLLKDLGCSSNAAKVTYLFGADDHLLKRSARLFDWSGPLANLKYCWKHVAPGGSVIEKLVKMAAMARRGEEGARQIAEVRCQRGADIARRLNLPAATAQAIYDLDEHYNGKGFPCGLAGEEISLLGRIACLSQTVEVFYTAYGLEAAVDVARQRRGDWFDPTLVDALLSFKSETSFWERVLSVDLVSELKNWEPADVTLIADELGIDRVAEAFAQVVDAKSPWTFKHSTRVAEIAVGVAKQFGANPEMLRDIRRAGLLHDVGKLGVSNLILDKPGRLTDEEFEQIKRHPRYSQQILQQVEAFGVLAEVAGAHHERLDGRGYYRGLTAEQISWAARVLTVADIYEALSAKRPYRDALPWEKIEQIMSADAGTGIDPECFDALQRWRERGELGSRVEEQMREVERLVAEL